MIAVVVIAGAVAFAVTTVSALIVAFVGVLFGVAFCGMATVLSRWTRIPYRWSLGIVVVALSSVVVGGLFLIGPRTADQIGELRRQLPDAWRQSKQRVQETTWGRMLADHATDGGSWMPSAKTLTSGVAGVFATIAGGIGAAVASLFTGLFLAFEPGAYTRGVVVLFPRERRPRVRQVLQQLARVLQRWLAAKLISMVVVGVLTGVGLWWLDVPLVFTLALLACVLTFIPNIGPVISAIPAVLLGFVQQPMTGAYVVLLYVVVQTIESYVVTPFVQRETVSLAPALVLTAQLCLGVLLGFAGLLIATPLAAAVIVLVQTLYIQDQLGDTQEHSIGEADAGRG